MVSGNAAFEDYNVRFVTLLKTTDLATQRMNDLATFAANTPFELPSVVQADIVLQGFGFHSAEAAQKFKFSGGLPKIHEHDGKPAQGYGLFHNGKLVVFYTYECDLGNGWEDEEVHKDPKETRLKALQMGANMLQYVFLN
jgi:hypothetical protein